MAKVITLPLISGRIPVYFIQRVASCVLSLCHLLKLITMRGTQLLKRYIRNDCYMILDILAKVLHASAEQIADIGPAQFQYIKAIAR